MGIKRHKLEEIVTNLRQVEVLGYLQAIQENGELRISKEDIARAVAAALEVDSEAPQP